MAQQVKLLPAMLGSHTGACSSSVHSIVEPVSYYIPGEAAEDGPTPWGPAPTWETQKILPQGGS